MTRKEAIMQIENRWSIMDYGESEALGEALDMAIEALQQEPIIHCEECKHHGTSNCPMWGNDTTEDYMWCCDGERMESDEE